MLPIVVFMIVIVVLAVAVLAFAAFHNRERELTQAPWLSEALAKAHDALPVVSTQDAPRAGERAPVYDADVLPDSPRSTPRDTPTGSRR